MGKKKTHEEFCEEFKDIYKDEYDIVDEYLGAKKYVTIIHNICGNKYPATPNNLLSNKPKCPICFVSEKTKTTNEFINEVYKLVGNEYDVLGEYINSRIGIKLRHNICNYEWEPTPDSFLQGKRCPKCSGHVTKTHKEFTNEVYAINKNIEILGQYKSCNEKVKCKCLIDGHIWNPYPYTLLYGGGCPKCAGNAKKTHEQFVQELYQINPNIIVLGKYKNSNIKIKCKCVIDNHMWYAFPFALLRNTGCPLCNQSKGEKKIFEFLLNNNINNIPEKVFDDCKYKNDLKFDFYLPKYNSCIEFQGLQHFEPVDFAGKGEEWANKQFELNQIRDQIKKDYCKENNIKLLEIPYWDINNIENLLIHYIDFL